MRFTFLLALFCPMFSAAQSVPAWVINATGTTSGSAIKLTYAVGEPVVGNIGTSPALLQGFVIPAYKGATISFPLNAVRIFPNPVSHTLHFASNIPGVEHAVIFNVLGQKVADIPLSGNNFNINFLSAGWYRLLLLDARKKQLFSAAFLKQ